MELYLNNRSNLFNAYSEFSCPDDCDRKGCKDPKLHVSLSLVDLIAISWNYGKRISQIFKEYLKIGFDPLPGRAPWVGRLSLELKKPCPFFDGKWCSIYPVRPISCALFPEYLFMTAPQNNLLNREVIRDLPCIQKACPISPKRKEVLQQLSEMCLQEFFLSDLYIFGVSPMIMDIKNIAGESFDNLSLAEDGFFRLPFERIEELIGEKLMQGGYLDEWVEKIQKMDQKDSLKELERMKIWTDSIAREQPSFLIAYQFEGNQLRPIHLL
ncbi:MAG: YkgJ family cysteine cluster protein [Thermodesulfobacteriota bacterium]